jgi:ribosomal protein S3
MGQKVHPVGFRLGITKPHQSQWFARFSKHQYSQTVIEDRLLRETLMGLFPKLLNPSSVKKNRDDNATLSPKITHIKIERGLIPYQIGIQIHAENCELIKSAIDNLTVFNKQLANLQKARRYFSLLQQNDFFESHEPIKETSSGQQNQQGTSSAYKNEEPQSTSNRGSAVTLEQKNRFDGASGGMQRRFAKKNPLEKRLKKRQERNRNKANRFAMTIKKEMSGGFSVQRQKVNSAKTAIIRNIALGTANKTKKAARFFDIFLNKTSFLKHLKEQVKYWNVRMQKDKKAPLGYNKKWGLNALKQTAASPIRTSILSASVSLERKALIKMDRLRQIYISSGSLSKAQTFGYYQIINFLKNLKTVSMERSASPDIRGGYTFKKSNNLSKIAQLDSQKSIRSLTEKAIRQQLNQRFAVNEECRKIKFIEYLKDIVKKHRQENIYYYLSTIATSRKYLRQIKQFTKRHSNFLFNRSASLEQIKNVLERASSPKINEGSSEEKVLRPLLSQERNSELLFLNPLQEIFLQQIEKQRQICKENIELTPKISIKFYNVKQKDIQSKATIVADSIIDSLEKRLPFKKVIKQAKRDLLKNPRVKGVKIEVSGRLNGAEIARSEWVRSGRVPLQTLTANMDYAYKTASTIYGIIGVKIWIFKGYTGLIK